MRGLGSNVPWKFSLLKRQISMIHGVIITCLQCCHGIPPIDFPDRRFRNADELHGVGDSRSICTTDLDRGFGRCVQHVASMPAPSIAVCLLIKVFDGISPKMKDGVGHGR